MTESDKHRIIKLNIEYLKAEGKSAQAVKSKIRRILKRNGLV
jgi:hypothetical protein